MMGCTCWEKSTSSDASLESDQTRVIHACVDEPDLFAAASVLPHYPFGTHC